MTATPVPRTLSANEAACVTGVPLRQVHRIIDAGLLGSAATRRERSRTVHRDGLVSLKLAHETTAIFTVDGRRRLVRYLLGHPDAETARLRDVSVDVRPIRDEVREGMFRLTRACEAITVDDTVLSGTPCVEGTRIPAHDIAEMLTNGDGIAAVRDAWPVLTKEQIEAAALYARAYPRRGRPRGGALARSEHTSEHRYSRIGEFADDERWGGAGGEGDTQADRASGFFRRFAGGGTTLGIGSVGVGSRTAR